MSTIRTQIWDEDEQEFVEITFDLSSQHEVGSTFHVAEPEQSVVLYGPNDKPVVRPPHRLGFHK